MADETPMTVELLDLAAAGDGTAWGTLVNAHQERLVRIVAFRMDSRLRGRIDAADVVQEAFVQAAAHREVYFREPSVPLILWRRRVRAQRSKYALPLSMAHL